VVVCFDSYIQKWTNWKERQKESERAMGILGAEVEFLGLSDKDDNEKDLKEAMSYYKPDIAWASTGSHKHHEWVGEVAEKLWKNVILYPTYEGGDFHTKGRIVITPTEEEIELKNEALDCYKSQLVKNKQHFDAVRGKPEWYV